METYFEGRGSDSPSIEAVWRGGAGQGYTPVCPASGQWHLLFLKRYDRLHISVQGPLTRATPVAQPEGTEWFGVTFPLGTFLPALSIQRLLDEQAVLPLASQTSFHLADSSWPIPDYENVETFIERLVRQHVLVSDPVVQAVLAHHPVEMSLRTIRRRFVLATGLPYKTIEQIERAKQATALLGQGVSLIDAAYQTGYADQSHLTRALKHFIGYTPALIARTQHGLPLVDKTLLDGHFLQDAPPLLEYTRVADSSCEESGYTGYSRVERYKEHAMRKIISLIHLSLNGFTSGPNDELDWIAYDHELEQDAHSLHVLTDAVIWGRRTYEGMASYWLTVPGNPASTPAELEHARFLDAATKIVVSRTLERVAWNNAQNTVLIKDHIAEEINAIKQQPGKDIWFLGSPMLARTFMELDLIDEYRININPTILGEGKALFAGVTRSFPLKLLASKTFQSGVVALRYEPDRSAK